MRWLPQWTVSIELYTIWYRQLDQDNEIEFGKIKKKELICHSISLYTWFYT